MGMVGRTVEERAGTELSRETVVVVGGVNAPRSAEVWVVGMVVARRPLDELPRRRVPAGD